MIKPTDLGRPSHPSLLLLPALALGLAACPADPPIVDMTESASGTEPPDETTVDPGTTPTDPDPSSSSTVDPPTTTGPTTTTVDPDTTASTINPETTVEPDTDTDTTTGDPVPELASVWAASNPAGVSPDALVGLTPLLDALAPTLRLETDVISIQSVAISAGNDAAITYDAPGGAGGILFYDNLAQAPQDSAIGLGDRAIVGPATTLVTPKGVEWLSSDLVVVADTGTSSMLVFMATDTGDVAPVATVTDLGTSPAVWDMHYVSMGDTLYAAGINGEVQVYDDFLTNMGAAGPTRTIVPTESAAKVSVNLHGIAINSGDLYLSDVGDPMLTDDGQLFIVPDAATADGDVEVSERVSGGMLGNPVDLEVRSGVPSERVFVAEKSNAALLVYSRTIPMAPLDVSITFPLEVPESVALVGNNGSTLVVARNAPELDGDAALVVTAPPIGMPAITATFDRLGSVTSVQSLVLDQDGDALVGFDGPAVSGGGGVFLAPGLATTVDDATISAVATRLWGPSTGIVAPKGLALIAGGTALAVADFGAGDIKVFDSLVMGDAAPLFVVSDIGGDNPWDVAYHEFEDRLFVAGTGGSVVVYDGFFADQGASGPARVITPSYDGGNASSVNLHGIAFDPATDTLFVSDVGDTMASDDGLLFIITAASSAEGVVEVQAAIGGANTKLGNPVDIAFADGNLYVAEKSNSTVLRYDGVLDLQGLVNEPEAAAIDVANPESVQLFYAAP
jgi:hypothetical protein